MPLIFEKSIWANVSMLAILKAGGAFVPLDADNPEGRLRAIMQSLQANIILCSAYTRDRAARLAPCALLVESASLREEHVENTEDDPPVSAVNDSRGIKAGNVAYAVFTSGSTDVAKGVMISHVNLATAIRHQAGIGGYGLNSKTRSLDSRSYAFDACVCNFFYTLAQGGCLCVPDTQSLGGDIAAFMRDDKVNWAQLVPSVARAIDAGSLPDLKCLILTGEPITQGDIDTWSHRVRLMNAYGPTECTILCAISCRITKSSEFGARVGDIGRGKGANLWLSEIGNPDRLAPVGAIGEILIEGPIIGTGYLGPYEYPLVINPAWLLAGTEDISGRSGTLFRTGDQAVYGPDGSLIFVGRIGSEIKLRGQRVDVMGNEDVVRRNMAESCTAWPRGTRYASTVHFRNVAFEPGLALRVDDGDGTTADRFSVVWYELVAKPHWTTVLVYPEGDVLRLWLLADPAEIGEEGADEILYMLAGFVDEIIGALRVEE